MGIDRRSFIVKLHRGAMKGKITQEYSEDMAPIVPTQSLSGKRAGNHKMLIKWIWKYAKKNELFEEGSRPPTINADNVLKKLFGKAAIQPVRDIAILKKNGHVKSIESAA